MKRFIISGVCISGNGSMGGNTKIALEIARFVSTQHPVVVFFPPSCRETVRQNLPNDGNISFMELPACPTRNKLREFLFYRRKMKARFRQLEVNKDDTFFTPSDFHLDVLLAFLLKPLFGFRWIASCFLFVPSPVENLKCKYGFPFLKYAVYYFYQRFLFRLILKRADGCVITNDCDRTYFPAAWRDRLFAFYGGVNTEQITAVENESPVKKYDLIFCSRLHPQKGLNNFLDIWRLVLDQLPNARFGIIGNGAPDYERRLKKKAETLRIDHSIDWLGYINNEAKYELYRVSRFLVHPTLYDNNGMVAAEALCTGIPVIMNDLPNLRTVYTEGCLKSDFHDKTKTAALIIPLLSSPVSIDFDSKPLRLKWDWATRCSEFMHHV